MDLRGYRKLLIALLFWASATALCAAGRINGGEFVAIAGLVMGLYGASNVVSKFSKQPASPE